MNNISIYPFIDTFRLVFNPKYTELYEYYDDLGMEIPETENVEKYIKLPYSLHGKSTFSFSKDIENENYTLVDFLETDILLEISYELLRDRVLKIYGVPV